MSSSKPEPEFTAQTQKYTVQENVIAVVELFQSQGCSSCPPTNSNVLRLSGERDLLILTYNVTYWDRLGWQDTFASTAFDLRQREYATALRLKNVYTPQVVVNGEVEGVGNDARKLDALIAKARATSMTRTIGILYTGSGDMITVSGPESLRGLVVVVRYDTRSVDVPVVRGENEGRTLPHNYVVKHTQQIGNWTGGSQAFHLPKLLDEDILNTAVLVSEGPGGSIIGVARIPGGW